MVFSLISIYVFGILRRTIFTDKRSLHRLKDITIKFSYCIH